MTAGAQQFITPLAVGALSGGHVFTELFSREDEQDVGHIRLAREADAIVIAPATADLMAKMANGLPTISPAPCCSPPTGRCLPPPP